MVRESTWSNEDLGSYYEYSPEIRQLLLRILYPSRPRKQYIKQYVEKKIGDILIAMPPEKIFPILESFSKKSYGFLETGLSKDFLTSVAQEYSLNIRDNKEMIQKYNIQEAIEWWSRTGISWRKWWEYDFFTERYEFLYCGDDYKTINAMYKSASPEVRSFLRWCKKIYIHCMLSYYAFLEGYKILIEQTFQQDEEKKQKYIALVDGLLSTKPKWRLSFWDYRVPENESVIAEWHTDSTLFNMVLYEDSQGIQANNIDIIKERWDIRDSTWYKYVDIPDKHGLFMCGRPIGKYPTFWLCPTPHRVENNKNTRLSIWFSFMEEKYFSEVVQKIYKKIYGAS